MIDLSTPTVQRRNELVQSQSMGNISLGIKMFSKDEISKNDMKHIALHNPEQAEVNIKHVQSKSDDSWSETSSETEG